MKLGAETFLPKPFAASDLEFGNLLVPHLALGYRLYGNPVITVSGDGDQVVAGQALLWPTPDG